VLIYLRKRLYTTIISRISSLNKKNINIKGKKLSLHQRRLFLFSPVNSGYYGKVWFFQQDG
jgi:hypothetical protein